MRKFYCILLVYAISLMLLSGCGSSDNTNLYSKESNTSNILTSDLSNSVNNNNTTENVEINYPIDTKLAMATLQYPSQNSEWKYNVYDCYVEITEYIGPDTAELIIPSEIENLPVWVYNASIRSNTITSIKLPETLLILKSERSTAATFHCENLERIDFPNELIEIGMCTFSYCYKLSDINLPDSLVKIGDRAFEDCHSLKSVILPKSVTEIGSGVFYRTNYSGTGGGTMDLTASN